jgi:nitrogen fixation/metabolism regulation signal transduction histidine kinase
MKQGMTGARLTWKITGMFLSMMIILGVLIVGLVYVMTEKTLREQTSSRASAIATNLSDAAATPLSRKNKVELNALAAKYGRLEGIAYVTIQNPAGEVVVYSPGDAPEEIKSQPEPSSAHPQQRELRIAERTVFEVGSPIMDGQLGMARVGVWKDAIQEQIFRGLIPLIALLAGVLLAGTLVFTLAAQSIVRPIVSLADVAVKMSRGDLETPIGVERNDEVGELARSLERMRASLRAAMLRLTRDEA